MSFMKPEIVESECYIVETNIGTEIVPCYVAGTVETCADLADYLEGTPGEPGEAPEIESGWLWRLSAPGYMDCTDWCRADTREEAIRECLEMYGNAFGEPEEWEEELRAEIPFRLELDCSDDAFTGDNRSAEIARILRDVASRLESGEWSITPRDINGNACGTVSGHDV